MDCKQGALEIGEQVTSLLDKMNAADYCRPLDLLNGASVGQHFRHIIEFYHCIIEGSTDGVIDYSSRKRRLELEKDIAFARQAYHDMNSALKELDEGQIIAVLAEFSCTPDRPEVHSSLGRELMFAYDHAIHHLAIIRIGIESSFPNLRFESSLGVAPATLRHNNHK